MIILWAAFCESSCSDYFPLTDILMIKDGFSSNDFMTKEAEMKFGMLINSAPFRRR